MPDHRGVGEQEDRLGDERAERGYGETEDVPVDRAALEEVHDGLTLSRAGDGRAAGAQGRPSAPSRRFAGRRLPLDVVCRARRQPQLANGERRAAGAAERGGRGGGRGGATASGP